jgi:hypothetical protein
MNKKNTLIVLSIVIVAALAAVGIFIVKQNPTSVTGNPNSSEAQTAVGTSSLPASPSAESSIVPATGPGLTSCVVLDEENCSKGTAIYFPTDDSTAAELKGKISGTGFSLPKETKIYAPFDGIAQGGIYTNGKEGSKSTDMIIMLDLPLAPSSTQFIFFSNAELESSLQKEITTNGPKKIVMDLAAENVIGVKVKKGELVGTVKNTNVLNEYLPYDYNFAASFKIWNLTISNPSPSAAPETVKAYFSYIK